MSWSDVLGRLGSAAKLVANLELQIKEQDKEIVLLRQDNADLRKIMAGMGERLARLEEARNTTAAEVKMALTETIAEFQMRALREENEALKRKQITQE